MITAANLTAVFTPDGRQPTQPPNPAYPNGMDIDVRPDEPGCSIELTHPTKGCGVWVVACSICGIRVAITTAGRVDDPARVRIPCKVGTKQ
jgi:hypothetical protein